MTITGSVTWNHHPQPGATVTINDLGAPGHGPARASTTTAADGTFSVSLGLPPNPSVGAFVPAHGPYLEAGRPAHGNGEAMTAGDIQLTREITGLSIHNGDRFPVGPRTFSWDPVPEATGYCVAVWRVNAGYQGPTCSPGAFGERVTTDRFTTPSLDPDLYAVSVVALTDVIVGDLPPRGLAFTVTP